MKKNSDCQVNEVDNSSLTSEKNDFLTQNTDTHNSTFQVIMLCINCSLINLYYGYQLTAYNAVQNTIHIVLFISTQYIDVVDGILNCIFFIGQAIGSALLNFVQQLSRRNALMIIDLFAISGSCISLICSLPALVIGRFLSGMATGLNFPITQMYIKEFTPHSIYNITGSISQIAVPVGILISLSMGLVCPENPTPQTQSWRLIFGIPAIFGLIRLFNMFFVYRLETPYYSLQKGQEEEARKALKYIYKPQYVQAQYEEFILQINNTKKDDISMGQILCGKQFRIQLTVGIICLVGLMFTGINVISGYSVRIFSQISGSFLVQNLLSIGLGLTQMICAFFSGVILQNFGQKKTLIIGIGTSMIIMMLIAILDITELKLNEGNNNFLKYSITILIFLFQANFGFFLNSVAFIIASQILPEQGFIFCNILMALANAVLLFLFPTLETAIQMYGCFLIFCISDILMIIFTIIKLKETKNLSVTEIRNLYYNFDYQLEYNDQKEEAMLKI